MNRNKVSAKSIGDIALYSFKGYLYFTESCKRKDDLFGRIQWG